jgi:subtilisin family serine protease
MKNSLRSFIKGILFLISVFLIAGFSTRAQTVQYTYYYRVYLKDKGVVPSGYLLTSLFSQRSVERRTKAGITAPDILDIPVNRAYLNAIIAKGFVLHSTSRWMNTGLFKTSRPVDVSVLLAMPFVKEVKLVKRPGVKSQFTDKLKVETVISEQEFDDPIKQVNGYALHDKGYIGKGILIGVLDGGFIYADRIEALKDLRNRNGIIATRNFVQKNNLVYDANNHGTAVMSVLAGRITNHVAGTAPGADYVLIKQKMFLPSSPVKRIFG